MRVKGIEKKIYICLILVLIDVFVKVVIDMSYMSKKVLVNDKLGFYPFLNVDQLSIFNNELDLNVSLAFLIFINILFIIFICALIYMHHKKSENTSQFMFWGLYLILAGTVCSLIDKVFWGGSLDYILIGSKIVDLKDIYMCIGFCIYLVFTLHQEYKQVMKKRGFK